MDDVRTALRGKPSRLTNELSKLMMVFRARLLVADWTWPQTLSEATNMRYHYWQEGGGYDRNINEANTLMFMIDYLHQNPVRCSLVEHAWQWKWSSAGWYEGLQPNLLRPDPIDPNLLPADLSRPRGRRF